MYYRLNIKILKGIGIENATINQQPSTIDQKDTKS